MDKDLLLSKTISWLRFPMIVGVVVLHVDIPLAAERATIFGEFVFFVRCCLADLAVPLFFFISGFLFFYKTHFCWETYKKKLHRRFYSLVIPYFFWILAFMVMTLAIQMFLPSLNNRKLLSEYSLGEFFNSFWNYSGLGYGCPMLSFLWFLRNLIVMVFFTPVVYGLIKCTRGLIILFMIVCYIFNYSFGIVGFPKSWLFFSFGAFFSIYRINFVEKCERLYSFFMPLGLSLLLLMLVLHDNALDNPVFNRAYLVMMIFVAISLVARYVERSQGGNMLPILTEGAFFVYLFHGFYINPLNSLYSHIVPINSLTGILGYFIITFLVCAFAIIIFYLLKRFVPKFCSVICGGR